MRCPICGNNELLFHLTLEPSYNMRRDDVEKNLPQIVAIQCKSGRCLFPVGEVLFKTLSLIYFNDTQHLERLDFIRRKTDAEVNVENLSYLDTVRLLNATLTEAVRRYNANTEHHLG